jgi:hypothetical protein
MNHLSQMPQVGQSYLISAFPGTGKSHFVNYGEGSGYMPSGFASDSDSSKFPKDNFPLNYLEHLESLIDKGVSRIFVSSHESVRNALFDRGLQFTLVYPDQHLKEEYLERYKQRGNTEAFIKLVSDNWKDWLDGCKSQIGCYHIELQANQFISNIC